MAACTVAMDLIPQLASLSIGIDDQHYQIRQVGSLVRDAAAAAIAADHCNTAVEWLEQGRSVIWSQLLQLRSPVDDLKQVMPVLAQKLLLLSAQLEAVTSQEVISAQQSNSAPVHYHQLALERDTLIKEIRQLPRFERFLLPKEFSQLLPAACGGPIAMLNISEIRCDALILVPGVDNVLQIPLENLTLTHALTWRDGLQSIIIHGILAVTESQTRLKGIRQPDHGKILDREAGLAYILENLWHCIAKPILDGLSITASFSTIFEIAFISVS